jgi:hypothetical protein
VGKRGRSAGGRHSKLNGFKAEGEEREPVRHCLGGGKEGHDPALRFSLNPTWEGDGRTVVQLGAGGGR